MRHFDPFVQSTPASQESGPEQLTSQGMPAGHFTPSLHAPLAEQSMTHVEASQPPSHVFAQTSSASGSASIPASAPSPSAPSTATPSVLAPSTEPSSSGPLPSGS